MVLARRVAVRRSVAVAATALWTTAAMTPARVWAHTAAAARGGGDGSNAATSSATATAAAATATTTTATTTTPTTLSGMLGALPTTAQVAAARRVPPAMLTKTRRESEITFTAVELARVRFAPLIATIDDTVDFRTIEREVAARLRSSSSSSSGADADATMRAHVVRDALRTFTSTAWQDMRTLLTFYEEVMYPIRRSLDEQAALQLTAYHHKDILKRGLTAFKQDYLDEQKASLARVQAELQACQAFMQQTVCASFSTAVCNDLVNILRIGGERYEHAHSMAQKVLKDMNAMHVPYDAITRALVHATVFGDGPLDDSALLFEMIEFPERGEVSLHAGTLTEVSDDMLRLISERHQTPLDDGVLLRSNETHPNLQRSPE